MVLETLVAATLSNLALCWTAFVLLRRYTRHRGDLTTRLKGSDWDSPALVGVKKCVKKNDDCSFLSLQNSERILTKQFSPWEEHDEYRTVDELLSMIPSLSEDAFTGHLQLANIEKLVKAIYQLRAVLKIPSSQIPEMLAPVIAEIEDKPLMGKVIASVDIVRVNERVDEATMCPLNAGLRVAEPLGLILRSDKGEIVSRAKVLCR